MKVLSLLVLLVLTSASLAQPRAVSPTFDRGGLEETILTGSGTNPSEFGNAVSLDGDRLAVGAQYDGNTNGVQAGAVYIFEFDGATWTETARLIASDGEPEEFFGSSVDLDGDRIAIGASNADGNVNATGAAYVFEFDGTTWTEIAKLIASDGFTFDNNFGYSIALDGDRIAVGDPTTMNGGTGYVFEFDGTGWTETAQLIDSDTGNSGANGWSIALDGDRVVVGALGAAGNEDDAGAAYVFEFNGSTWTQTQKLIASDGRRNHDFGRSVALDGDRIVVGARNALDPSGLLGTGAAYLYTFDGTMWAETEKLTPSDGDGGEGFGHSVALRGNRIAAGAPYDSDLLSDAGSAYVFALDGTTWNETKVVPSDATSFALYGWAVSVTPDRVVVGATVSRKAYVYELATTMPAVTVSGTPVNPPVVIPPQGGSFQFTVTYTNTTAQPQTFETWTAVNGLFYLEPIKGPRTVTLPASTSVTRTLTQRVSGNVQEGTTTYRIHVGTLGVAVLASASFPVTKQGGTLTSRGTASATEWSVGGWDEQADAASGRADRLPEGFLMSAVYPNPFRDRAHLSLETTEAQHVLVELYDALGRRVAVLHDGMLHDGVADRLTLEPIGLPSGVYVVRASGETFLTTRRVTLIR